MRMPVIPSQWRTPTFGDSQFYGLAQEKSDGESPAAATKIVQIFGKLLISSI